jgi:hypothetical protein
LELFLIGQERSAKVQAIRGVSGGKSSLKEISMAGQPPTDDISK